MCYKWKIYILGHPQTQHSTGAMRQGETELLKYLHYIIGQDEAKVFTYVKTHISVSSAGSQQCWYQAVVCISTPRRYMRRRHFFLNNEWIWVHINISSMDQSEFKRIWSITDNMWLIFFFFNWIQRFFNQLIFQKKISNKLVDVKTLSNTPLTLATIPVNLFLTSNTLN